MIEIGVVSVDNHQPNSITTIRERKKFMGVGRVYSWLAVEVTGEDNNNRKV